MNGDSVHTTISAILAYERLAATLDRAHKQASILLATGGSFEAHRRETLLRMASDLYDMKQGAEQAVAAIRRENARVAS